MYGHAFRLMVLHVASHVVCLFRERFLDYRILFDITDGNGLLLALHIRYLQSVLAVLSTGGGITSRNHKT